MYLRARVNRIGSLSLHRAREPHRARIKEIDTTWIAREFIVAREIVFLRAHHALQRSDQLVAERLAAPTILLLLGCASLRLVRKEVMRIRVVGHDTTDGRRIVICRGSFPALIDRVVDAVSGRQYPVLNVLQLGKRNTTERGAAVVGLNLGGPEPLPEADVELEVV